jgi:hypothetical protein
VIEPDLTTVKVLFVAIIEAIMATEDDAPAFLTFRNGVWEVTFFARRNRLQQTSFRFDTDCLNARIIIDKKCRAIGIIDRVSALTLSTSIASSVGHAGQSVVTRHPPVQW